jgi:hypothetical protein
MITAAYRYFGIQTVNFVLETPTRDILFHIPCSNDQELDDLLAGFGVDRSQIRIK